MLFISKALFILAKHNRASAAPLAFAIHSYPVDKRCPVSCYLKDCRSVLLSQAQSSFERSLAKITLADLVGQIRQKMRVGTGKKRI